MKIIINDHRQISDIQKEFERSFANLKIVFFAKASRAGSSPSRKLVHHGKPLLACRSTHQEGVIEISPSMSIRELKDHFSDVYGLSVKVLRKSPLPGESTISEKRTLQEENEVG